MSRVTFDCLTHKGEFITNYCCLRTCLSALCPDCIDEHNKKHQNEHTVPEIDTLKRVQGMCANKLDLVGTTLEEFLAKLNSATNIDLETTIQSSLQDLENIRKKLIDQINAYFKSLQDEYISKSQSALSQVPDFRDLKLKIRSIIDEVGGVRTNLDNQNCFDAIRTTINLDQEALFSNVDRWISDAISTMITLPTHLVYKESYYQEFFNELRNMVTLDTKEVKLISNERVLAQKQPQINDRTQGLVKNYFDVKFKNG